jgi:hypothetical protein
VVGPRQLANRWLADFEIGVDAVTGSVPDRWQIVEIGLLGKAKLAKARQIKQGMMQELLTGRMDRAVLRTAGRSCSPTWN